MQISSDVVLTLHYFYMTRRARIRSHPRKQKKYYSSTTEDVQTSTCVSNENIKTDVLFSLIVTVEFCHSSVNKYFVDSLFIYVIKKKTMYKDDRKKSNKLHW